MILVWPLIGHVGIGEKACAPLAGQLVFCETERPTGATHSKNLHRTYVYYNQMSL